MDLQGVVQRVRPDFDQATPGLKEAWERGDRDQFLVDTAEEPIRDTEGKASALTLIRSPWSVVDFLPCRDREGSKLGLLHVDPAQALEFLERKTVRPPIFPPRLPNSPLS